MTQDIRQGLVCIVLLGIFTSKHMQELDSDTIGALYYMQQ